MRNRAENLTRRRFLKTAATAGATALAFPKIVRASSLGRDGATAPSNRVNLGVIGAGGKGTGGMMNFLAVDGVQVTDLCDPNDLNRQNALNAGTLDPTQVRQHRDFRELLARPDVDAVLIATQDHWHVAQAIAAVKAGKDVYCEKPMSNTIAEGRALVETVRRYSAVFQHGTQLRSTRGVRLACELVRNGYLGEITSVRVGSPPGVATGLFPAEAVPDWLDYGLWLGPAPWAPYNSVRIGGVPGVGLRSWYFISDYSKAGWISGFGVHDMDIAHWALDLEHTGPVEVEGTATFPQDGMFDTALTYHIEFKYANGMTITLTDTGENRHGVLFEGTKGKVHTRGGIETDPPSLAQVKLRPKEVHLCESSFHEANFIDCVRRRSQTIAPVEVAHRSTSVCLLGGIAVKLGRRLRWDPGRETFVNDEEANRLLACAMRDPWPL